MGITHIRTWTINKIVNPNLVQPRRVKERPNQVHNLPVFIPSLLRSFTEFNKRWTVNWNSPSLPLSYSISKFDCYNFFHHSNLWQSGVNLEGKNWKLQTMYVMKQAWRRLPRRISNILLHNCITIIHNQYLTPWWYNDPYCRLLSCYIIHLTCASIKACLNQQSDNYSLQH